jgi:hypothetical protein
MPSILTPGEVIESLLCDDKQIRGFNYALSKFLVDPINWFRNRREKFANIFGDFNRGIKFERVGTFLPYKLKGPKHIGPRNCCFSEQRPDPRYDF